MVDLINWAKLVGILERGGIPFDFSNPEETVNNWLKRVDEKFDTQAVSFYWKPHIIPEVIVDLLHFIHGVLDYGNYPECASHFTFEAMTTMMHPRAWMLPGQLWTLSVLQTFSVLVSNLFRATSLNAIYAVHNAFYSSLGKICHKWISDLQEHISKRALIQRLWRRKVRMFKWKKQFKYVLDEIAYRPAAIPIRCSLCDDPLRPCKRSHVVPPEGQKVQTELIPAFHAKSDAYIKQQHKRKLGC